MEYPKRCGDPRRRWRKCSPPGGDGKESTGRDRASLRPSAHGDESGYEDFGGHTQFGARFSRQSYYYAPSLYSKGARYCQEIFAGDQRSYLSSVDKPRKGYGDSEEASGSERPENHRRKLQHLRSHLRVSSAGWAKRFGGCSRTNPAADRRG